MIVYNRASVSGYEGEQWDSTSATRHSLMRDSVACVDTQCNTHIWLKNPWLCTTERVCLDMRGSNETQHQPHGTVWWEIPWHVLIHSATHTDGLRTHDCVQQSECVWIWGGGGGQSDSTSATRHSLTRHSAAYEWPTIMYNCKSLSVWEGTTGHLTDYKLVA